MSDPGFPIQSPPPKPFAAEPAPTPGGCGKPLLIGCGVLAILLGIGAVLFVVKAKSLLAYALDKLQAEVVRNLPEDVDDADRARLETAFDATMAKIKSGQIDAEALQNLQSKLVAAAGSAGSGKLTRAEVLALTRALETFAGIASDETPAEEEGDPAGPPERSPPDGGDPPAMAQPVAA